MIVVSNAVVREIRARQAASGETSQVVRIGVRPGGCSGLEYTFDFATTYTPDEVLLEQEGLLFVCSAEFRPALDGLRLDYRDARAGGGFRFGNPNAARTCGCGASFQLHDRSDG